MKRALDRNTCFASHPTSFGSIRKVPAAEAARWPRYSRRPIATARRRDWTHDQIDELTTLVDNGLDYAAIARRLGRTPVAIQVKVKRIHCAMTKRPTVLTSADVGRLLGLRCSKKVADWIARGWLSGTRRQTGGPAPRTIWAVQWDALMTFLQTPAYWMSWQPEHITDTELRTDLLARRRGQPRWLTPGHVARQCHVGASTVGQWITKGWLPATRYGNWWIWSADLEGWMPPCARSRVGIPRAATRRLVGATHLEAA